MNLHVTESHSSPRQQATHPLDPLSAAEISRVATILHDHYGWGDEMRVETVDVAEPDKALVRAHHPGADFDRIARYNVFRRGVLGVWRGRIDLNAGTVLDDHFDANARAMVAVEEVFEIEAAVKADPRFREALRRRGLLDEVESMCIDPWTVGDFGHEIEKGRRVLICFVWMRTFPLDNYYAHPVEGLHALIDLANLEILQVEDHFEANGDYVPVPRTPLNYDAAILTDFREPSSALDVVQPEGAGFQVEGRKVTWENWDFRVGFNGREGLVLHEIGYTVAGRRRPIVYRASIAEMVVPYGTPERSHYRKNVFDSGELGFGRMANALTLGCDCLGVIHYFDAVVPDVFGQPRTIDNCICLHEEDAGLSWKHFDVRSKRTEVRRARKLVVSSISTIGNYEYASYWYLHQDGRIEYEMKATGIINTAACHPGQPGRYGTEVAPGVVGHIHQHIFSARLDMEVDGPGNTVVECDTISPPPGPENPYGNAFYLEETVLRSELMARRNTDYDRMRYWKIINPGATNWLGQPTAYKLEATSPVRPFTHPGQPFRPPFPLHPAPALGDALQRGRALSGWGIRQSVDRGRRPAGLDRQGPAAGKHRPRALAQLWAAPRAAAGRPPGSALRGLRLYARTDGLLRSEPRHRPARRKPTRRAAALIWEHSGNVTPAAGFLQRIALADLVSSRPWFRMTSTVG